MVSHQVVFCFRIGSSNLVCLCQMTARSVLLAMAATSFLRGDEPLNVASDGSETGSSGTSAFGGKGAIPQRWRECDQQAQLSLASANPQVETSNHFGLVVPIYLLVPRLHS